MSLFDLSKSPAASLSSRFAPVMAMAVAASCLSLAGCGQAPASTSAPVHPSASASAGAGNPATAGGGALVVDPASQRGATLSATGHSPLDKRSADSGGKPAPGEYKNPGAETPQQRAERMKR